MLVCLLDSLFIISNSTSFAGHLLVRAWVAGDIERVWPGAEVQYTPALQCHYRATLPRQLVAVALVEAVMAMGGYDLDADADGADRRFAYQKMLTAAGRLQERRANPAQAPQPGLAGLVDGPMPEPWVPPGAGKSSEKTS